MPEERQLDVALNRFWNDLTHTPDDADADGLDLAQVETLRRLHTMTRTPPPGATRARLDREMQALYVAPRNGKESLDLSQVQILTYRPGGAVKVWTPPAIAERPAPPRAAMRFHWAAVQRATALLLVVILTLGLVAVDLVRPRVDRLASIPAAFLDRESAIPSVTNETTLIEVALPADVIPHGTRVSGSLAHFSLPPGTASTMDAPSGACCPGFRFDYVLEGTLEVRPAGSARVFRTGANLSPEVVAGGGAVVLGPGDAVMLRYEDAFESANPGMTPVELLDVSFIEGFFQLNADPPAWDINLDADAAYSLSVPDEPATLRVQRVDLAAGATLQPPPGAVTQLGITLADDAPLDAYNTETITNMNKEPVIVHVATLISAGSGDEEPVPPATDVVLETVFATTLPAEMIPTAGNLDFLLWNVTLEPNTRGPASAQSWTQTPTCCPGPQITHVLEGELSVRVEGPLQIFRGSAGAMGVGDVPPGTEVTLHPGDTAVFSYELPAEYANHGSDLVRIVGGGIFAGAVRSGPAAQSHYHDYNEVYAVPPLPAGPLEATLVRAILPPDGVVPAPPPGALVLDVGALGDADIAQRADGTVLNIGEKTESIYVLTLMPTRAEDSTPDS